MQYPVLSMTEHVLLLLYMRYACISGTVRIITQMKQSTALPCAHTYSHLCTSNALSVRSSQRRLPAAPSALLFTSLARHARAVSSSMLRWQRTSSCTAQIWCHLNTEECHDPVQSAVRIACPPSRVCSWARAPHLGALNDGRCLLPAAVRSCGGVSDAAVACLGGCLRAVGREWCWPSHGAVDGRRAAQPAALHAD